jgi:hypothetical protein
VGRSWIWGRTAFGEYWEEALHSQVEPVVWAGILA